MSAAAPGHRLRRGTRSWGGRMAGPPSAMLLAVAVLVILAVPAAAYAHAGSTGTPGFTSKVLRVQPTVSGLDIRVVAGDDRLRVELQGNHTVVIDGYDKEPYLRFDSSGVYQNVHSPAVYLNEDRYGKVALPATANANVAPSWQRISNAPLYQWHDHRIHWMSTILPPQVRSSPKQRHHVFDWTVPGTVDGRPLTIAGTLDYAPPQQISLAVIVAIPVGISAVAVAVLVWGLRRRRRRSGTSA